MSRPPRALVTGGAGFLGSHVCERLLAEGWAVLCLDSLLTGRVENLGPWSDTDRFAFLAQDVCEPLRVEGPVDWILHLASPASPRDYLRHPIETLRAGAIGTLNCLDLAEAKGAGFLLASTSEVYGDPLVHPQPEGYWGNVNPVGPRSVYDEAKRYAEALAVAYDRARGVPVKIVRIFNTYGPRMRADDGRAIPTFIRQALAGRPITVHGDGSQTRTLCYVDDLVEGILLLLASDLAGPVNLGGEEEITIRELAELVRTLTGSRSEILSSPRPVDDPQVRRPDLTLARTRLGWAPRTPLREGLARTIRWFEGRVETAVSTSPAPAAG
ncbi:MAG TPA: UDP-glucuronic acid decarboxylase family protein [Actinomycetota bacterium]|nr:UDP-glucuronic acid decarboxylase family protein [Actinomycetota bacterium]